MTVIWLQQTFQFHFKPGAHLCDEIVSSLCGHDVIASDNIVCTPHTQATKRSLVGPKHCHMTCSVRHASCDLSNMAAISVECLSPDTLIGFLNGSRMITSAVPRTPLRQVKNRVKISNMFDLKRQDRKRQNRLSDATAHQHDSHTILSGRQNRLRIVKVCAGL